MATFWRRTVGGCTYSDLVDGLKLALRHGLLVFLKRLSRQEYVVIRCHLLFSVRLDPPGLLAPKSISLLTFSQRKVDRIRRK